MSYPPTKADVTTRANAMGITGTLSRSELDKAWQRLNEEEANRLAAEEAKKLDIQFAQMLALFPKP